MELENLRREIDAIDEKLVGLLVRRLHVVDEVAAAKRISGKAVLDSGREAAVLDRVSALADEDCASDIRDIFTDLMAVSRARQAKSISNLPR